MNARDTRVPLDLQEVVFEQRDVRMYLRVSIAGGWAAADLRHGLSVCLIVVQADAPGRICAIHIGGREALGYAPSGADRTPRPPPRQAASVSRPSSTDLEATFLPAAAGISVGPLSWSAEAAWTDRTTCATGCVDRLPDSGDLVVSDIGLLGFPRCFGAAARDPTRSCDNPSLDSTLEPPLTRAKATLDSYCDRLSQSGPMSVCEYGASPDDALGTFALIGDSHAASLKTALHVVELAKRWRGVSIVRAGCPATRTPAPILPTPSRSRACTRWNRLVLAWARAHRGLNVVFLAANAGAQARPTHGRGNFETVRAGYRSEILALLETARRVVVIRDTPSSAPGHLGCIARAVAAAQRPGTACALQRFKALPPDPLAAAAQDTHSRRVQLIDLTSHFCDVQRCFPVVGGALVHRDETHLTPAFSASLGPFILAALRS
jgi:hypothetical protein